MKRLATLLLIVLATSLLALADDGPRTCSLATIRGTYGFAISGTRPVKGGGFESVVGTAITTFDGAGNLTQTDNIHGSAGDYIPNRAGTGTYTINADCSGTMHLKNEGVPFELVLSIVAVNNGKEIRAAVVDISPRNTTDPIPPIMVQSIGKKI